MQNKIICCSKLLIVLQIVFGTVRWLRGQRRCLVSNSEQYRFVYDVLEDYVTCGDTAIDLEDLSTYASSLTSRHQDKVNKRLKIYILPLKLSQKHGTKSVRNCY